MTLVAFINLLYIIMIIITFVIQGKNSIMSDKIKYAGLNLPESLVEELKVWRMAYAMAYGRTVSYSEMFRKMLDALPGYEPSVDASLKRLLEINPELASKMSKFGCGHTKMSK